MTPLRIFVAFFLLLTVAYGSDHPLNQLECEESEDGEVVHCSFSIQRKAMRKNLDTCIHEGNEMFCVEAKMNTLIRKLSGSGDDL